MKQSPSLSKPLPSELGRKASSFPLHGYPVVEKDNAEQVKLYDGSNPSHIDSTDNAKQVNESTEQRTTIWMWIKANPLEVMLT